MTNKSLFFKDANFYKGNLHSHTIVSDGQLKPEESVRAYKERGYHFLVISDHETYSHYTEFDSDDFIVYPGIEDAIEEPKDGQKGHHIHGILGTKEMVEKAADKPFDHLTDLVKYEWHGPHSKQKTINRLIDAGNLTMYNHPIWSRLEQDDLLNVEGIFAIEIFNYGCEVEDATGNSTTLWDMMLRRGKKVYGIATDDNHNNYPLDSPYSDSFGGWIVVKAKELSQASLAEAISQGSFYSSSGPEIYDYTFDGERITIQCSPVAKINFISYETRGQTFIANKDESLTEAVFKIRGNEIFIRAECVDHNGKIAWTNPIFLDH